MPATWLSLFLWRGCRGVNQWEESRMNLRRSHAWFFCWMLLPCELLLRQLLFQFLCVLFHCYCWNLIKLISLFVFQIYFFFELFLMAFDLFCGLDNFVYVFLFRWCFFVCFISVFMCVLFHWSFFFVILLTC